MASGFRSGSLAHLNYYEETILLPSLHVMGLSDSIIPMKMSESLAACFEDPQIVQHSGGHYFAATSSQKDLYIDFFRDRLIEYLERKEQERSEVISIETSSVPGKSTTLYGTDTSDDSE